MDEARFLGEMHGQNPSFGARFMDATPNLGEVH